MSHPAIDVIGLRFRYQPALNDALVDVELQLTRGSRSVMVGANGAGKTTLLRVVAGKHMTRHGSVQVLGTNAFADTSLAGRVVFLGGVFPLEVDITVAEILAGAPADARRRDTLLQILGVDPAWHMHRVSDGQRRRVQLLLGLLRPCELLLLDEITTDLDLLARADLLRFLVDEVEQRGLTILYTTHILERLEDWATHLVYLRRGTVALHAPLGAISELGELRARNVGSPLSHLVERWLRAEVRTP